MSNGDQAGARRVAAEERTAGDPTAGMIREQAFSTDRLWVGMARTAPGSISGWHHHGDHETAIYVVKGAIQLEAGPGGREKVRGEPGDFLMVGANVIHREGNPTSTESEVVVVRTGTGPVVVNVEGPTPG